MRNEEFWYALLCNAFVFLMHVLLLSSLLIPYYLSPIYNLFWFYRKVNQFVGYDDLFNNLHTL